MFFSLGMDMKYKGTANWVDGGALVFFMDHKIVFEVMCCQKFVFFFLYSNNGYNMYVFKLEEENHEI